MIHSSMLKVEALYDSLLLLEKSDEWSGPFREALGKEMQFAMLASCAPLKDERIDEYIDYCHRTSRSDFEERKQALLSLAVGLLTWNALDASAWLPRSKDERLRSSALLYRMYYGAATDMAATGKLLHSTRERATIKLHTFIANTARVEDWIDEIWAWDLDTEQEIDRLAELVHEPNLHAQDKGMLESVVVAPEDDLLQILARVRSGEWPGTTELTEKIQTKPACLYGAAVRKAYRQVIAARDRFNGSAA